MSGNQRKQGSRATAERPEDDLLKNLLLLSLAHDFMSPFRALAGGMETVEKGVLEKPQRWYGTDAGEIRRFYTDLDERVLPEVSALNGQVKARLEEPFEEIARFLQDEVGKMINEVVVNGRAVHDLLKPGKSADRIWNDALRDIDFALRKIRNMLDALRSFVPEANWRFGEATVSLNRQADQAIAIRRRQTAVELDAKIDGDATVVGDPGLLYSVFQNLIGNAIKYRHKENRAKVRIRISQLPPGEAARVSARVLEKSRADEVAAEHHYHTFAREASRHPGWVEVCVRDYGIGIPRNWLWGVFRLYRQLQPSHYKKKGGGARKVLADRYEVGPGDTTESHFGFGLTICRYYVRLHKGEIVADSREGGPTTFAMWLPVGEEGKVRESAERFNDNWWNER